MLKMLMDPMGGIVMTNDGNAILREVDVSHPAAKSLIELSRAQDEEVGDGTTSVIILTGEIMGAARPFFEREMHPTVVVGAYYKALDESIKLISDMAVPIDVKNDAEMRKILNSCVGTKFAARWGDLVVNLALKAVRVVTNGINITGKTSIDIKRYAKVEKVCILYLRPVSNKNFYNSFPEVCSKSARCLMVLCATRISFILR